MNSLYDCSGRKSQQSGFACEFPPDWRHTARSFGSEKIIVACPCASYSSGKSRHSAMVIIGRMLHEKNKPL